MTSLLLDTAAFLWVIQDHARLSKSARSALLDSNAEHYLSHVSLIEITIKYAKGNLKLSVPPHQLVREECIARAITLLPIDMESIYELETLSPHHGDPFDRLLICQAIAHNLIFITPDRIMKKYKIRTIW